MACVVSRRVRSTEDASYLRLSFGEMYFEENVGTCLPSRGWRSCRGLIRAFRVKPESQLFVKCFKVAIMAAIALPILVAALAFVIGYAIRRGSICAVAATHAFMVQRRSKRLRAFAVAVAAAGLVIVPLHWAFPDHARLSISHPPSWAVVMAGAVYAIGARVNDACAFGTLAHLTGGRLAYAMTLIGAALGVILVVAFQPLPAIHENPRPSIMNEPSMLSLVVLSFFLGIVLMTIIKRARVWWQDLRDAKKDRLGPFRAMLIIGTFSGLLYSVMGGWTHMGLLSRNAALVAGSAAPQNDALLLVSAAALFAGGLCAALRSGRFEVRWPRFGEFGRCLMGGLAMGASAAIVPGGNGILLVHGIPSLAVNACVAYAVMTVVLCVTFWGQRKAFGSSDAASARDRT